MVRSLTISFREKMKGQSSTPTCSALACRNAGFPNFRVFRDREIVGGYFTGQNFEMKIAESHFAAKSGAQV